MNSIFHRISVRKYQDKPVEEEKMEMILKAAMAAPSARNQQPWEFYVVTDKAVIKELSMASPYATCAKDAPVVFVPCGYPAEERAQENRYDTSRVHYV